MKKVFVINKNGHDYNKARAFGKLVYLTEGYLDAYNINKNYRLIKKILQEAQEGDYILVTGLSSLNLITGWILGYSGLNLNILLWKKDHYIVRRLVKED